MVTVKSVKDLENLTGKELVILHNELSEKQVKKFSTRADGIKRMIPLVEAELARQQPRVEPAQTPHRRIRKVFDHQPTGVRAYRRKGKRAHLIGRLLKGATFEDLLEDETLSWKYKVLYENIYLLHVYVGFGIRETGAGLISIFK